MKVKTVKIEKLLQLYEKHPCLYDFKNLYYHRKAVKEQALQDILSKLEIEDMGIDFLKKKLLSIKTRYQREYERLSKLQENGMLENQTQLSWFRNAKFLQKSIEVKEKKIQPIDVTPTIDHSYYSKLEVRTEKQPEENIKQSDDNFDIFILKNGATDQLSIIRSPLSMNNISATIIGPIELSHSSSKKDNDPETKQGNEIRQQESSSFKSNQHYKIDTANSFQQFANFISFQLNSMPTDVAEKVQIEIQNIVSREISKLKPKRNL